MMAKEPRDLVERTYRFARDVRGFVRRLSMSLSNHEDAKQVVRASGSVAANYLESREGLSRRDFFCRIKVCRKETRGSGLWLRLIDAESAVDLSATRDRLVGEAQELKLIFSAIAG